METTTTININVIFVLVLIIVLAIVVVFVLLAYRTFVQKIMQEKNEQYELQLQYQKELLENSIKVQEQEREQIAAKLHDDIGNKLNILSVWLKNPDTWNNTRSKEIVVSQLPALIETTRNISHALYPAQLERFGLAVTIEELVQNVAPALGIRLIIRPEYTPRPITTEVQIYRVIQEFMNNVLKHAEASRMCIHLRDGATALCIVLADNGKGFDTAVVSKGMGLRNIEWRLDALEAVYKWKSTPGNGCRLVVVIGN